MDHTENQPSRALVVYDFAAVTASPTVPVSDPVESESQPPPNQSSANQQTSRTSQSIVAFAVQCSECYKWRVIPSQEKYEEIRANIFERRFSCSTAREWQREVSCDDPADISQDESRTWAIDLHGLVQPPPGWKRQVRIRAEGGTKFSDVNYVAPSHKRLRSMGEVEKYLDENPVYAEQGVTISQFSFQGPKPLKKNYVRKSTPRPAPPRPAPPRPAPPHESSVSQPPLAVIPISWIGPDGNRHVPLGGPGPSTPNGNASPTEPENEAKRRRTESN